MKKKGFTLIELLVALTIIGLLVGFSLVSYQGSRKTARDAKRKADLEQIRSALEMYRTDCGRYPVGNLKSGDNISCGGTTYLQIPPDPLGGRQYIYSGNGTIYIICAGLETNTSVLNECSSLVAFGLVCQTTPVANVCSYSVKNP